MSLHQTKVGLDACSTSLLGLQAIAAGIHGNESACMLINTLVQSPEVVLLYISLKWCFLCMHCFVTVTVKVKVTGPSELSTLPALSAFHSARC